MPRPLRIEFPGACYHVMFRGNARMPVFREDADKELLVDRMAHFASLFRIRIRAYCVMVNHAHIHVRTDEANLGRYMQSFLTSYTARHNHRHGSCGHVFQGRYKAFLVEDCRVWRSKCTRYIHLNPARIPGLDDAPVETRREAIRQCRWSSLGAVLGLELGPVTVSTIAAARQRVAARAAEDSGLRQRIDAIEETL